MFHVDTGHLLQQFASKVLRRADADIGKVELARILLSERDQPFDVFAGKSLRATKTKAESATHETGTKLFTGS